MIQTVENKIKYKFKDASLLEVALTHSSMQKRGNINNERLEFLGDRVLGLVIADILFKQFPDEKEGLLAKRHTALVQQDALLNIAEKIKIDDDIKVSAGEAKTGGKKKKTIMADAMEALIGAIYTDGGYDSAYKFIENFWEEMLEEQENPPEDVKSFLQEWAQSRSLPLPQYTVVGKSGSDHSPEFEIEVFVETLGSAKAKANSKKMAEKLSAEKLLKKLEEKEQ